MKVVIAGSRDITDFELVANAIKQSGYDITEVVSGGARGPDTLGEMYAVMHDIEIKQFIPDWDKHKKYAGILRNREMADYCDAAVIIWDGESRGTKNMIEEMLVRMKPHRVFIVNHTKPEVKYANLDNFFQ